MNITHLKYALEVERTGSITKAAENLFMGQPNLSRVIREMEESVGVKIFSRTSKGIAPTENGRRFLNRAAEIVRQTEELESMFKNRSGLHRTFRVAGQSSCSLLHAFSRTVGMLEQIGGYDCHLEEGRSAEVLERIQHSDCSIGILRADSADIDAFQRLLTEKNIRCTVIGIFRYVLVVPRNHPLAREQEVTADLLEPYTLVTSGDRKEEGRMGKIAIFRSVAACMSYLHALPGGYMISRPLPKDWLDRYDLVMIPYEDGRGEISDLLIHRADHILDEGESVFVEAFRHAYWDMDGMPMK